MTELLRLVIVLLVFFLFLPLLDKRVRGRYNRRRYVQILVVTLLLVVLLAFMGRSVS